MLDVRVRCLHVQQRTVEVAGANVESLTVDGALPPPTNATPATISRIPIQRRDEMASLSIILPSSATTTVRAKGRKKLPAIPVRKAIGRKTATVVRVEEVTAVRISRAPV